ncbi:MAG: hypothetical protein ACXQS8_05840 [Candidatus Helarchaeales archaeon]
MKYQYFPLIALLGFLASGFIVGFLVVGPGLYAHGISYNFGTTLDLYGYAGSMPIDPLQTIILGLFEIPIIVMIILTIRKIKRES